MHRFSQVDVFTDRFTSGNPLAVVHDADDLCRRRAGGDRRWTNLCETTFLLRPTDPDADYRVRIFTPRASCRSPATPRSGRRTPGRRPAANRGTRTIVQECGVGLVPVRVDGPRLAFAAPPPLRRARCRPRTRRADPLARVSPDDVVDPSGSTTARAGSVCCCATPMRSSPSGPTGRCRPPGRRDRRSSPAGEECDVEVRRADLGR